MTEREDAVRADRHDPASDVPDAARPEGDDAPSDAAGTPDAPPRPTEIGGQKGPEPTRYGDWEGRGRCTDF